MNEHQDDRTASRSPDPRVRLWSREEGGAGRAGGAEGAPPAHPSVPPQPAHPAEHPTAAAPPAYPGEHPATTAPPAYPNEHPAATAPPTYPDELPTTTPPPAYPNEHHATTAPPAYPDERLPQDTTPPAYPAEHPATTPPPAYPNEHPAATAPPTYPDELPTTTAPPAYPGEQPPPAYPESPATGRGAAPPACPGDARPGAAGLVPPRFQPPAVPPVPVPLPVPEQRVFDPSSDLALHDGRRYVDRRQRGADATAVSELLTLAPHFLCSAFIVSSVAVALLGALPGLLVLLAWLASGALVFHRPTERRLAVGMFHLRPPTREEFAYLAPIWSEIGARSRIDHTDYELWIEESDEINAVAAAGHIVGVTKRSLTQLPPGRLAAVLAHELGHHTGGHTWARLIGMWYALPARLTWAVTRTVLAVVFLVAQKLFWLGGAFVILFMGVTVVAAALVMPWLFLPIVLTPYLLAAVSRAGEYRADRKAAELGFAPTLVAVLREAELREAGARREKEGKRDRRGRKGAQRSGVLGRLLSTHPPSEERVRRLMEYGQAAP